MLFFGLIAAAAGSIASVFLVALAIMSRGKAFRIAFAVAILLVWLAYLLTGLYLLTGSLGDASLQYYADWNVQGLVTVLVVSWIIIGMERRSRKRTG